MLNKEIGKLCFYLSMNFIHLGDGSCKEVQTAILHFHNLVGKSHKRCIFRHNCAICPPHCVPSTILVCSGTEMFGTSCCFVRPLWISVPVYCTLSGICMIGFVFQHCFLYLFQHKAACMTEVIVQVLSFVYLIQQGCNFKTAYP